MRPTKSTSLVIQATATKQTRAARSADLRGPDGASSLSDVADEEESYLPTNAGRAALRKADAIDVQEQAAVLAAENEGLAVCKEEVASPDASI